MNRYEMVKRILTLDEKISIKGKLARKGLCLPKLTLDEAVHFWTICYGTSVAYYYKFN
jgi:hypothetical protein